MLVSSHVCSEDVLVFAIASVIAITIVIAIAIAIFTVSSHSSRFPSVYLSCGAKRLVCAVGFEP